MQKKVTGNESIKATRVKSAEQTVERRYTTEENKKTLESWLRRREQRLMRYNKVSLESR